ncbi:hypothetical protein TNCV_3209991 [Trichonephila clavipes]|nr:hypothetical protein TNCV_3209991 [Trichonephila clavipes]
MDLSTATGTIPTSPSRKRFGFLKPEKGGVGHRKAFFELFLQLARRTSELAPHSPNYHTTPTVGRLILKKWPQWPSDPDNGQWSECHEFEPSTTEDPLVGAVWKLGGVGANSDIAVVI